MLVISGSGKMEDYPFERAVPPWKEYLPFVSSLVLEDGLASVGDGAFCGGSAFTGRLAIPNSVISIGRLSFSACSGFSGDLLIPAGVGKIGQGAFAECSFSSVRFEGASPELTENDLNESGGIFSTEDIPQDFRIFCSADCYDSFANSKAFDASTGTWEGIPLAVYEQEG